MKIGVVLSGGAVRGTAHIGVLKALEEKGVEVHAVSGVSAGAIIGALYCSGYSPEKLKDIALKTNFLKWFKPSKSFKSLFSLEAVEEFLKEHIPDGFSSMKKKFFVTTTNLTKGSYEFWSNGDLYRLVRASSSIPFLFEPVEIGDELYVDGGLMNNLPVEPLRAICDYVIAVDVNPMDENKNLNNIFAIAVRSFYLSVRANIEVRKSLSDIFIQPKALKDVALFDLRKIEKAIEIGYEETKKVLTSSLPL